MIRLATPTDEPEITACVERAYARYVPLMGRRPAPMDADYTALIAAQTTYVAVDDAGEFQGLIVFYPEAGAMLLENVAVLPRAAGQGVGKSLIAYCENSARRAGLPCVRLYTNEKMTENLSIYPRMGYVETDRRSENGFNRVYFEKRL